MTIQEAKADLEVGHTLELDLPAHDGYRPAIYHALMTEQKQYLYNVYYPGVSSWYEPLFASADWDTFFFRLPHTLQTSTDWSIL